MKINPSFEGLEGKRCFQESKLKFSKTLKKMFSEEDNEGSYLTTGNKLGQKGLAGQESRRRVVRPAGLREGWG